MRNENRLYAAVFALLFFNLFFSFHEKEKKQKKATLKKKRRLWVCRMLKAFSYNSAGKADMCGRSPHLVQVADRKRSEQATCSYLKKVAKPLF